VKEDVAQRNLAYQWSAAEDLGVIQPPLAYVAPFWRHDVSARMTRIANSEAYGEKGVTSGNKAGVNIERNDRRKGMMAIMGVAWREYWRQMRNSGG